MGDLISLGSEVLVGAQSLAGVLGLAQNTPSRISADLYDYIGDPGENPVNPGKLAAVAVKSETVKSARAARRAERAVGRKFCAKAVDIFKAHLGRTWNSGWSAAGFSRTTIAASKGDVHTMLFEIRNYLRGHPAAENAPLGITATLADAHLTAVEAANSVLSSAIAAHKVAAQNRDAAEQKLRERISGLRSELDQLLADDDFRWYQFGFSRPIDESAPEEVSGLLLTPAGAGQVVVTHKASARALDYRVSWKLQSDAGDRIEFGLFADRAVTLNGLPTGFAIVVSVTARNNAGETPPVTATIVVP